MLKLKTNIVPTGTINGTNKTFTVGDIIGGIDAVYIDGVLDTSVYAQNYQIITSVAPSTSITVNYLYREVPDLQGDGLTTLGTLKTLFYRKIGRVKPDGTIPDNIARLFPVEHVREELYKSAKRLVHKSPETLKIQTYSYKTLTGYKMEDIVLEDNVTNDQALNLGIQGILLTDKGTLYDYYGLTGNTFSVKDVNITEGESKVVVGVRVPYGVDRISSLSVDGDEYHYANEFDFHIDNSNVYTIITDFQGQDHIILPYSDKAHTVNVKYIPQHNHYLFDEQIVEIPYEFADVIVYDTAYRLLKDKEDDRWQAIKEDLGDGTKSGLLYEYQSYVKSKLQKTRKKIGFSSTYSAGKYTPTRNNNKRIVDLTVIYE